MGAVQCSDLRYVKLLFLVQLYVERNGSRRTFIGEEKTNACEKTHDKILDFSNALNLPLHTPPPPGKADLLLTPDQMAEVSECPLAMVIDDRTDVWDERVHAQVVGGGCYREGITWLLRSMCC